MKCAKSGKETAHREKKNTNSLPETLIVLIERYEFNPKLAQSTKIKTPVYIDKKVYLTNDFSSCMYKYELRSVVTHNGEDTFSGHYAS